MEPLAERVERLQAGVDGAGPDAAHGPAISRVLGRETNRANRDPREWRVGGIRGSWLAVRSIEPQPDGRKRFAHTAPWHFVVNSRPQVPRRVQVQYFISLMEQEIQRNREILPPAALAEFEVALQAYQSLQSRAR